MNKRMLFMLYFHNNIDKMKKRFFRYTILLAFIFSLLSSVDLKRQSQWGNGIVGSVSPDDYRWTFPIPVSEYRFNKVEQNPGWSSN